MDFLINQRVQEALTGDETESQIDSGLKLNEDILVLQSVWWTECNAPELLQYNEDLVESVKEGLDNQQVSSCLFSVASLFVSRSYPHTHTQLFLTILTDSSST
jgi:hypothetical protein